MIGREFTLHIVAKVLRALITPIICAFVGDPHRCHLMAGQASVKRGPTQGEEPDKLYAGTLKGKKLRLHRQL